MTDGSEMIQPGLSANVELQKRILFSVNNFIKKWGLRLPL
ncbi:MAG: hypothetical protein ANABAC_3322 [Anaerolineae bacterium]|nr:MAG: hypothetical protein ANABAC_3322 [Anaerolineae bacterium]